VSDEPTHDDRDAEVLERLIEELAGGAELGPEPPGAPRRVRREYLEILGLMGASVDLMTPSAELKKTLLAEVGRRSAAASGADVVAMQSPASRSPYRRWALPLAASLAIVLAGFSIWQAGLVAGQRATIERLSQRLEEVEARTPTVAAMRDQITEMRSKLAFVSGRGVEICALRPMAIESREANSRGLLYVSADHNRWYLTIDGLVPCKQGRSYQLWFVREDGEPISAGTFDVIEGVRVELSSDTMPSATRAVTVTLEPAGGSAAPTGPAVLHGDEVMAVL
jgi:hypothetical protein